MSKCVECKSETDKESSPLCERCLQKRLMKVYAIVSNKKEAQ